MSVIKLPELAWFGARERKFELPEKWHVKPYPFAGAGAPAMTREAIARAIASPIGTPPIREMARGKNQVIIIFDDMTRVTRTYDIAPAVLEELKAAGIPDSRIQFICALGSHNAWDRAWLEKKLGKDILSRFPVYNHNPFNKCTYVGTTSYGTRVSINDEVAKCDLKIAIGSVVPHPNTGYGGGGKIILPGVSSIETIEHFHRKEEEFRQKFPGKPLTGMGNFDENPLRLNVEEAATLAGLNIKIDALLNMWGDTVAIFAGSLKEAYTLAVKAAKTHYLTPMPQGADILIANTYAKANESIMIGLNTAFKAAGAKGADIVLIANAPDGQVMHYLLGICGRGTRCNMPIAARIPPQVGHVIIFSEYPDMAGRCYIECSDKVSFMDSWEGVLQTLEALHPGEAGVAVLPNVENQYCA